MSLGLILLVLALVCFVLAAVRVATPIDLTALGLFLYVLNLLIGGRG